MRMLVGLIALTGLLTGCGPDHATAGGKLLDGANPVTFPAGSQAFVRFHLLNADGTTDPTIFFTGPISPDGSFELLSSAGQLPPGKYRVVVEVQGKEWTKFNEAHSLKKSKAVVDVTAGKNVMTVNIGG